MALNTLKMVADGNAAKSTEMLQDLVDGHRVVLTHLEQTLRAAQATSDEASVALLSERVASHEKMRWMLKASL